MDFYLSKERLHNLHYDSNKGSKLFFEVKGSGFFSFKSWRFTSL